ncbi:MAG: transglycosylase domain-containing protein, partial [Chitinophagales bacterium]
MTLRQQYSQYSKYNGWFWRVFFGGLILTTLFILLLSFGVFGKLPSFDELENPQSYLATQILSSDGELLGRYYKENRTNINYQDIPAYLVDALISTEDKRFYDHAGIDARSLGRVIIKTGILGQESSGGGSTLTQQLAKNLYGRPQADNIFELGVIKIKEWVTASKLERRYTKEEIITMYCNTVEYIYDAHGVQTAAKTFFNKSVDSLSLNEAALLVGMVKNPSLYNPISHPQNAFDRKNTVLALMVQNGKLADDQFENLKNEKVNVSKFKRQDHKSGEATYFREYLRLWLRDWCEDNPKPDGTKWDIYRDGLKVHT